MPFEFSGRYLIARIKEDGTLELPVEWKPDIMKANDGSFYCMGVPKSVSAPTLKELRANIREMQEADVEWLEKTDLEIASLKALREEFLRAAFSHAKILFIEDMEGWTRE
jgi:hypothetical protein